MQFLRGKANCVVYDRGGNRNSGLDREIHPLHLSPAEKQDLLALLGSLLGRMSDAR